MSVVSSYEVCSEFIWRSSLILYVSDLGSEVFVLKIGKQYLLNYVLKT